MEKSDNYAVNPNTHRKRWREEKKSLLLQFNRTHGYSRYSTKHLTTQNRIEKIEILETKDRDNEIQTTTHGQTQTYSLTIRNSNIRLNESVILFFGFKRIRNKVCCNLYICFFFHSVSSIFLGLFEFFGFC